MHLDLHQIVLQSTILAVAFCRKPETSMPDEEMIEYVMGEDLGRKGGLERRYRPPWRSADAGGGSLPVVLAAIAASTAASCFFLNLYLTRKWLTVWEVAGVPTPPFSAVWGHSLQIRMNGGIRATIRDWCKTYGKVFGYYEQTQPVLVVADAALAEEILENVENVYFDRYGVPKTLREELGEKCLFLARGVQWDHLKHIMSIVFLPQNLVYMVPRLNRCANVLAEYMEDIAAENSTYQLKFNMKELITSYSHDTMAALILGKELDSFCNPKDDFLDLMKSATKTINEEFCENLDLLKQYFRQRLKEHRSNHNKQGLVDFLDLLTHTGSPSTEGDYKAIITTALPDEELVASLVHWVLHGHQTMVSALQFILHLLATYQDHQQIVFAEICNQITTEEPTYEDLCNLSFLDMFIKETMRTFSPVQEIWRRVSGDTIIGQYDIPANTAILIPVNIIHADIDYFFEPELFEPERYIPGATQTRSDVFLSFGCGPRTCPGYEVALMQMKVAIAHIMPKVKLTPPTEEVSVQGCDSSCNIQAGLAVTNRGLLRPRTTVQFLMQPRRPQDVFRLEPDRDTSKPPTSADSVVKERDMLRDKVDSHVHFLADEAGEAPSTDPPASNPSSSPATPESATFPFPTSPSSDTQSISPPVGDLSIGTSDSSPDSASSPDVIPPWKIAGSETTFAEGVSSSPGDTTESGTSRYPTTSEGDGSPEVISESEPEGQVQQAPTDGKSDQFFDAVELDSKTDHGHLTASDNLVEEVSAPAPAPDDLATGEPETPATDNESVTEAGQAEEDAVEKKRKKKEEGEVGDDLPASSDPTVTVTSEGHPDGLEQADRIGESEYRSPSVSETKAGVAALEREPLTKRKKKTKKLKGKHRKGSSDDPSDLHKILTKMEGARALFSSVTPPATRRTSVDPSLPSIAEAQSTELTAEGSHFLMTIPSGLEIELDPRTAQGSLDSKPETAAAGDEGGEEKKTTDNSGTEDNHMELSREPTEGAADETQEKPQKKKKKKDKAKSNQEVDLDASDASAADGVGKEKKKKKKKNKGESRGEKGLELPVSPVASVASGVSVSGGPEKGKKKKKKKDKGGSSPEKDLEASGASVSGGLEKEKKKKKKKDKGGSGPEKDLEASGASVSGRLEKEKKKKKKKDKGGDTAGEGADAPKKETEGGDEEKKKKKKKKKG